MTVLRFENTGSYSSTKLNLPFLSHSSKHPNLPCSTGFHWIKMGGACLTPRGLSSLSILVETSARRIKVRGHEEVFLSVSRWGGVFSQRCGRQGMCQAGETKHLFWKSAAFKLNLWSLLSKLSWKPFALQQLQAVVLCLCEVTNSTTILCVGNVFI